MKYDYPHILPTSVPLDKKLSDKYRYVCLDENDGTIAFLQSFEEKITDMIERLIHLLSLSELEKEEEFQKEFIFYWNDRAVYKENVRLYIRQERIFQKLNAYKSIYEEVRFVTNGIFLNDTNEEVDGKKKWNHLPYIPVFYIPITDKRRILPPTRGKEWDAKDILMIICGRQFNRITNETYIKLGQEKVKTKQVGLIFEMVVDGNCVDFTAIISFKSSRNDTLLNKLKNEIDKVEPIKSKRTDYYHLCKQIGNETMLLNKKVLLVGAGSLGSYIARELVKAGVKDITIYDRDCLEDENLLRHTGRFYMVGISKVTGLKHELELIHPEIRIHAVNNAMDCSLLVKEMKKVDLIIFAVGSSDIQWEWNRVLRTAKCKAKVIYTWLEAGGNNSHILTVDYDKKGCFQCLFTDEKGNLINNKANKISETDIGMYKIRNGCGGTRVAYGNAVLLRTVAVLLNNIQDIFDEAEFPNRLINITSRTVIDEKDAFVERKCGCCGIEIFE